MERNAFVVLPGFGRVENAGVLITRFGKMGNANAPQRVS